MQTCLILHNKKRILFGNFLGLSITVDSSVDINLIEENSIEDLVDHILFLPNNIISKHNQDMSMTNAYGLSKKKLVIGLSLVVFVVPDLEKNRSKILSFNELRNGSNLNQWKPRIQPDDQVI